MSKANQRAKKERNNQILRMLYVLNEKCQEALEVDEPEFSLTDPNGTHLNALASRIKQTYESFKSGKEITEDDLLFAGSLHLSL